MSNTLLIRFMYIVNLGDTCSVRIAKRQYSKSGPIFAKNSGFPKTVRELHTVKIAFLIWPIRDSHSEKDPRVFLDAEHTPPQYLPVSFLSPYL